MPKATVKKTSINLKFTTSKARKDKVVMLTCKKKWKQTFHS